MLLSHLNTDLKFILDVELRDDILTTRRRARCRPKKNEVLDLIYMLLLHNSYMNRNIMVHFYTSTFMHYNRKREQG